ncbi:MAG: DUF1553 domain-containing protein [Planctomycetota bacterium]|nr:DUF1553 domain-containing protein [Planctomycetota bacterium]
MIGPEQLVRSATAVVMTAAFAVSTVAQAATPDRVSYNRDVRPILAANCFKCHGFDVKQRKAGRRLDTRDGAIADHKGVRAIVPGSPDTSELLRRVGHHDPEERMPPVHSKKPALSAPQIAVLRRWIAQGAEYERHWAFIPPEQAIPPTVAQARWSSNPIDRFVADQWRREGLEPSPAADRRTLIRRVTLDLTGLLPTPAEVAAFVGDSSAGAYARLVDRLLASRHYGERMCLDWLDAARYGDTSAYHADGPRDMWKWRDGVIAAFNDNMPYDRFTHEQLAGDLIPQATIEQQVASGFNRNHCTSDEGGAFPEELRVSYIVDRVRTTSMVFLGMSLECCQCHDHKYDPFTQEEFYKFYAFFNGTKDGGMQTRGGNAKPVVGVLSKQQRRDLPIAEASLADLSKQLTERSRAAEPGFRQWLKERIYGLGVFDNTPPGVAVRLPLDGVLPPTAKVHGKIQWLAGRTGKSLRVNGGKNFVSLGTVGDYERTDAFSYGAWVFPEAKRQGAVIARMDDANSHRGFDLLAGGAQTVAVHLIHKWASNAIKVTTKKTIPNRIWSHVFVTYDGSSKAAGLKIYINGQHVPVQVNNDNLTATIRTKTPLHLGRRHPGSHFQGRIADVHFFERNLSAVGVGMLLDGARFESILRAPSEERTVAALAPMRDFYLRTHDAPWVGLHTAVHKQKGDLANLQRPKTTVMVMSQSPRKTFRLDRGAYDRPVGDELKPDVPTALPPLEGRPANRLGLAQWLTSKRHPLTARVTVNRFWYMLFGRGIVRTVEDFGSQGSYPTHPELLDWLALDFVGHGWDVKRTIRQMVMSQTYRQSTRGASSRFERDPDNSMLSRGPRFRLSAEFLRDVALQTSGLLVADLGGPGVKPYQPPGLWNEVSLNRGLRFRQDKGVKLYRRSLYTYWKRSAPPPSMRIFDAPTRERCVLRRGRTNTPLQALVTLNDPQFLEASRFLAQRMIQHGGGVVDRVAFAYQLVLCRAPEPWEVKVFQRSLEPALARYRSDPASAKAMLAAGEARRDESIDAAEHAAWMVVASMILNTDEALTKG